MTSNGDGAHILTKEEAKNYHPVEDYRRRYGEDPTPEWLELMGYDPEKYLPASKPSVIKDENGNEIDEREITE
jgi:hypothetical protein